MQSRQLVLRANCPNIHTMIKGLVPKSATYKCQSITHNENSTATLATIYLGGNSYEQNRTIIDEGVIVWTWATRCDGIVECYGRKDENGCDGPNTYSITFIGILHY